MILLLDRAAGPLRFTGGYTVSGVYFLLGEMFVMLAVLWGMVIWEWVKYCVGRID